jgi:hypothetical protein
VHHPNPPAGDVDHALTRKRLAHCRLVHVSVHALDRRPERTQLVEERRRDEVAAVQDEVGAAQQPRAFLRERARTAWQVRVGDDGDATQRRRSITVA